MLIFVVILEILFVSRPFFPLFVLAIFFYAFLIFLDTKYVASRVRGTLNELGHVRASLLPEARTMRTSELTDSYYWKSIKLSRRASALSI